MAGLTFIFLVTRARPRCYRAARAGNVEMLSLLIELARTDDGNGTGTGTGVEAILRMQNGVGEMVLHEAIRADHTSAVDVLMSADPCLARHHQVGVASPLFLAVSLCRYGLAQKLYERDNQLSYSGPGGQNALHAAVLRNKAPLARPSAALPSLRKCSNNTSLGHQSHVHVREDERYKTSQLRICHLLYYFHRLVILAPF
jgi:ankyrin repeat protein